MADRVLFISWGATVRGREARAFEVFNEAMGMLGRMQQEGRIESFDVALLTPNGDIGGYVAIRGSIAQIDAVRQDAEFLRRTADTMLIVDNVRHIEGSINEGVARQMEIYQEASGKVPQLT
jgi:hypothetical protein